MKKYLRVRLLQMDIRPTVQENLKTIEEAVAVSWNTINKRSEITNSGSSVSKESGYDVLVLPELFTTGYHKREKMMELAEDMEGPTIAFLKTLAQEKSIAIGAGSFVERAGDHLYNTSVAIDSKGVLLAKYRKTHLFRPMHEDKIFERGDSVLTFELFGLKMATITCYEIRFPELARKLALEGAKVIFCLAEWPHPKKEVFLTLGKARAIENQVFFVSVNRVGKQHGFLFCGSSHVAEPGGSFLALASEHEEILDVEIDLGLLEEAQKTITVMEDRRPDTY